MPVQPLRLALIGPARFGVDQPYAGGLEAHTATTARAMASLGHRVTVFAGPATARRPRDLDVVPVVDGLADLGEGERLDTAMSPESAADAARGYIRVLRAIDRSGEFDVIHNNSLHSGPVDFDGRTPIVHVLHCPPFDELADAHRRRAARSVDASDGVISVSSSLARQWTDGAGRDVAGHVVWNGVDTRMWRPAAEATRDDRCVWAGRFVSEKAPHLAIDAARRSRRPIVLAGPVQEPRYFQREIAPRLGADATYVGHLDNAGLSSLYSTSRVGVVTPCWDEPFGLVVAEMLACGLPVAGFARGALPDIVSSAVGVLAAPGDVDGLATTIDQARRLSSGTCRSDAVARLSMDRMTPAYVEQYGRAIDSTRQPVAV